MTNPSFEFEHSRAPDEQDYELAFQYLQESFLATGGPTAAVMSLRRRVAHGQQTRVDYTAIGSSSKYMEEVDEKGAFEDRSYASLHAFNRGFFIGHDVVEMIYDSTRSYSMDSMHTMLSALLTPAGSFQKLNLSPSELHRTKGFVLREKGEKGLAPLNSRTIDQLEGWADELYPYEERPNRSYRLGVGAVLYCGHKVFDIKSATKGQLRGMHGEELTEYESPDTGEAN